MSDGTGIGGCRFSLGYTWSPGGTIKPGFSKPSSILRKFLRYLSHKNDMQQCRDNLIPLKKKKLHFLLTLWTMKVYNKLRY